MKSLIKKKERNFILPTIATSYSIRNNVVPRHCFIRLCASCNVAPPTLIPFIAKTRSPILIVPSLYYLK
jgi:hypothetical protein